MKIRVTLITENDKHLADDLTNEEAAKITAGGWNFVMAKLASEGEAGYVENVEILER